MKEQLINFETAKLAKEKRFDVEFIEDVNAQIYDSNKELTKYNYYMYCFSLEELEEYEDEILYLAPAQSFLQKWLREEHNIHININTFYFIDIKKFGYEIEDIVYDDGALILSGTQGKYEEALEKGLYEALKLIK